MLEKKLFKRHLEKNEEKENRNGPSFKINNFKLWQFFENVSAIRCSRDFLRYSRNVKAKIFVEISWDYLKSTYKSHLKDVPMKGGLLGPWLG